MKYLNLIRYQNLLLLALMQLMIRFGFLKLQSITLALTNPQYILLVVSTILIAAAGYVINNIFDQETDLQNKPNKVVVGKSISETQAYNLYAVLNITGVAIGFYLSNAIGKPGFASIFILIAASLYLYATSLKQILLIGNLIVALLLCFSIIIVGIFDLYPILNPENQQHLSNLFSILLDYSIFAFMINLLREIVKDIEDYYGDSNQGMRTLPIVLGISRTTKLVFFLSFVPIFILLKYINTYFIANDLQFATIYFLLFIVGPLVYFSIKIWNAKTTKDFHHLSTILKLTILFGVLSIGIISYNIYYNA
jgi:4-hydroxybenzoate polyprenyltransferase